MGIYRVAGNARLINELRLDFIADARHAAIDDARCPNISSVAALLKLYLRELPEPVFTSELYPAIMEAAGKQSSHAARIRFLEGGP